MNAICLVKGPKSDETGMDAQRDEGGLRPQEAARWTTKQVMAACLWSALFGVGCGYAWMFLQIR